MECVWLYFRSPTLQFAPSCYMGTCPWWPIFPTITDCLQSYSPSINGSPMCIAFKVPLTHLPLRPFGNLLGALYRLQVVALSNLCFAFLNPLRLGGMISQSFIVVFGPSTPTPQRYYKSTRNYGTIHKCPFQICTVKATNGWYMISKLGAGIP